MEEQSRSIEQQCEMSYNEPSDLESQDHLDHGDQLGNNIVIASQNKHISQPGFGPQVIDDSLHNIVIEERRAHSQTNTLSDFNDRTIALKLNNLQVEDPADDVPIHGFFFEERLVTIRKWLVIELIILDILVSLNLLPKLHSQQLYGKIMAGLLLVCTLILVTGIALSYAKPDKWLKSIGYLIQVIIFKKELVLAQPFLPESGANYNLKNVIRILAIPILIFIQMVMCLYLYESKRLKQCLPHFHFTVLYSIVVYQYLVTDGIEKSDIVFLVSVFVFLHVFLLNVFKTLNELANSQLKDEIKISDHRKYKDIFNSLQEGIIIVQGTYDPILNWLDYQVQFSNEIADIIFKKILGFARSLDLLTEYQQKKLMSKKLFHVYRSAYGAESREQNHRAYSLANIINMDQDEINQKVFVFEQTKAAELLDSTEDVTEIQQAL